MKAQPERLCRLIQPRSMVALFVLATTGLAGCTYAGFIYVTGFTALTPNLNGDAARVLTLPWAEDTTQESMMVEGALRFDIYPTIRVTSPGFFVEPGVMHVAGHGGPSERVRVEVDVDNHSEFPIEISTESVKVNGISLKRLTPLEPLEFTARVDSPHRSETSTGSHPVTTPVVVIPPQTRMGLGIRGGIPKKKAGHLELQVTLLAGDKKEPYTYLFKYGGRKKKN